MRRYQDVFSLAPAPTIDGLFRDDVLPNGHGDELVDYWQELVPQMVHTDELGGFQLLEIRSSLAGRTAHVRRQTLHGPWAGSAGALPRSHRGRICAAAGCKL